MDWAGVIADVAVGRVSPRARARFEWWRASRGSDPIPMLLAALVRPGATVVDAGASWGLFTDRLARLVGPTGAVHAFEPNPANFRSLRRIAHGRSQVLVHRHGLSSDEGEAVLRMPRGRLGPLDALGTVAVADDRVGLFPHSVRIPLRPLDAVVGEGENVSLLKCDVEGHEGAVLDGAAAVLATRPSVLIEIEQRHRDRPVEEELVRFASLGYEGFVLRAERISPLADFDVERDQLAYLELASVQPSPPPEYANNFLFVQPQAVEAVRSIAAAMASPRMRQS